MQTITVKELESLLQSDQAPLLIDVRTPAEYQGQHIPGALNYPLGNSHVQEIKDKSQNQEIICICKSGQRAKKFAEELSAAGSDNHRCLQGGTQAWISEGLPVEGSGKDVMSIERQVRIGAGAFVLLGILISYMIHPAGIFLSAFVGAGLIFAGITDWCGMALVLAKMPWNCRKACS